MRRLALLAAAILLLAGLATAAIWALSGDGPAPPPAPPAPAAAPDAPQAALLPPQAQADLSRVGRVGEPPPPMQYAPAPAAPPPGTWEAIPPVARAGAKGPLGAALQRFLASVQPRLVACFDEVSQARHGQTGYTAVPRPAVEDEPPPDPEAPPAAGNVVLMLHVETFDGQARIADAPVVERGGASDGLLACAQSALRGQAFPAPGVRGGTRHRVLHGLAP